MKANKYKPLTKVIISFVSQCIVLQTARSTDAFKFESFLD